MSEASPLKSREYLAYGIPVIGAYCDSDVDGCDFFLRLANTEQGVADAVESVRDFIYRWKGKEIDMEVVRAKIDMSVKEKQRLDFFARVLAASVG